MHTHLEGLLGSRGLIVMLIVHRVIVMVIIDRVPANQAFQAFLTTLCPPSVWKCSPGSLVYSVGPASGPQQTHQPPGAIMGFLMPTHYSPRVAGGRGGGL